MRGKRNKLFFCSEMKLKRNFFTFYTISSTRKGNVKKMVEHKWSGEKTESGMLRGVEESSHAINSNNI
jgi:hypothetical protein